MRQLEHDGRQALFDMIYTGLDGYLQPGDTFGVWTFNDQVNAGTFPMQVWNSDRLLDLAKRATLFVKDQPYSGRKPALDRAVTAAQNVVRMVKDLNILIVSDATARLQGTPFDDLVNGLYEQLADDLHRTAKPLVTTLVARDGRLVNATVTLAGEPIFLPPRPTPDTQTEISLGIASAAPGPTGTKSSPTQASQETTPPTAPNRPKSGRTIIITAQPKEPRPDPEISADPAPQPPSPTRPGQEQPSQQAAFSPDPADSSPPALAANPPHPGMAASIPPSTPPTPVTPEPEKPSPSEEAPPVLQATAPPQPEPTPTPHSQTPGPPRIQAAPGPFGSGPRTVAAREPGSTVSPSVEEGESTAALTGLATPSSVSRTGPRLWLTAGLCLLVLAICLGAVFWRLHRKAYQPSVITKSMGGRELH